MYEEIKDPNNTITLSETCKIENYVHFGRNHVKIRGCGKKRGKKFLNQSFRT